MSERRRESPCRAGGRDVLPSPRDGPTGWPGAVVSFPLPATGRLASRPAFSEKRGVSPPNLSDNEVVSEATRCVPP